MTTPTRTYFTVVPSGYLILQKDDHVLLLRRHNTSYHDGDWGLPAGHIEEGELALAGTIREAKEEVGLDLKPSHLTCVHVMHRLCGDHQRVDIFFIATNWSGEPTNCEPHRCDQIAWFPLNNLPSNTIPYIREALAHYQYQKTYSEFTESDDTIFS